jgi:hypothetical protein
MKIIDNFLNDLDFEWIMDELNDPYFNWHFSTILSDDTIMSHFRKHGTLLVDPIYNTQFCALINPETEWIKPLLDALGAKKTKRIKVNLTLPTKDHQPHGMHIDYAEDENGTNPDLCKTAIYYVNSNNGYTQFENGDKVESVVNRVVIFDNGLWHEGVSCTNTQKRLVININYYE